MKSRFILLPLITAILLAPAAFAQRDFSNLGGFGEDTSDLDSQLQYLRDRLGEVNVSNSSILAGSEYEALIIDADRVVANYPDSAEAYGWRGIIKYHYRGTLDEVSSLAMAESARNDLETAISIDPSALDGLPLTMLGSLYLYSPIWPAGFGDEERAGQLLRQGLALSPDTLESNYLFGRYLLKRGELEEARFYLEAALKAPSRPGSEAADFFTREDITELLDQLTR